MKSRVTNIRIKRINSLIALLVLFIGCFSISNAQQVQVGYVNVADVMLLHPTMRYFDTTSKRFKLEALKGINAQKRVEENKAKYKADLEKLEQDVKEFEAEKIELEEEYYKNLDKIKISNNKLQEMTEREKNKYNEKIEKLSKKFHNEADEIRKKIYHAKQKIETFKNNSLYTSFTTQGETSKLFSLMLDDVYDAMGAVAKHYKVSFVFNSSAEITYIEGRMTASNPMGDFLDNFDLTVQSKDGKKITGAAFASWLGEKSSTFLNCNDRRLSSFVMDGGLNMTPAVIDYIYQKHKVGKAQRDFIVQYYDKIVNGIDN